MAKEVLRLTDEETALAEGAGGEALAFAMGLVVTAARAMGAQRLLPASFLHIDACHYAGRAHLDFARHLVAQGAKFQIPAWTNTIPVSLTAPDPRLDEDPEWQAEARDLAGLYLEMAARPVWTCAPYQLPNGPGFGDTIVVGESNAVAYYNSVVGARTNKYGDFLDVACGLVARVPDAGLNREEARRAVMVLDLAQLPESLRGEEVFGPVLGHLLGRLAGSRVAAIAGLPTDISKDALKGLAAAAAASGGVALFHAAGVTPEAPSLEAALQGQKADQWHRVTAQELVAARDSLSSAKDGPLAMVALGTPHFSFNELGQLVELLDGRRCAAGLACYVSTNRHVAALAAEKGWTETIEAAGVTLLTDTCTYFSPAVKGCRGRVMTNSAKWAYYAPGMLPVEVAFGSLADCVESAVAGEVRRDPATWSARHWGA